MDEGIYLALFPSLPPSIKLNQPGKTTPRKKIKAARFDVKKEESVEITKQLASLLAAASCVTPEAARGREREREKGRRINCRRLGSLGQRPPTKISAACVLVCVYPFRGRHAIPGKKGLPK